MITLVIAVICLVMGMIIGTAIQVSYPSHPREMWRGFKAVVDEYVQGFDDINKKMKEHNNK